MPDRQFSRSRLAPATLRRIADVPDEHANYRPDI
jgi:hypothetical protein